MPIPLPRLDDRSFDQLMAEGLVLLSRHAPGWTDYNAHDPGITLLELLAWLAETGFYRLDRIPAASYRAFLLLAGVEPRPAQVAETVVVAQPKAAAVAVPAGARVDSADGQIAFQTAQETSLTAARLEVVLSGRAGELELRQPAGPRDRSTDILFPALGVAPQIGDALYLGFDQPLLDTPAPLGLYVSTRAEPQDRRTRARLEAEHKTTEEDARREACGRTLATVLDERPHYSARLAWEYFTANGAWAPLADIDDQTRALTLSGLVRFKVRPGEAHAQSGVGMPAQASRYFIRARLASGRYDCPPRIGGVLHNALGVRHVLAQPRTELGRSTGRARQVFALGAMPVVPWSTTLEVGGDRTWVEKATWDGVGPHDRAYVVAHDPGVITFGDGRVGRVPPAGAILWATHQTGGGPSGNIAPGTLTSLAGVPDVALVSQPFAALGGEAAEGLDQAIGRALERLAAPSRAVTLKDFEELVLAMPGVPVARVHAIGDYRPDLSCLPALGSITVVVIPQCPPARPEPSPELLCAVARFLERRRTVTTELHVVGPCYSTLSVRARLHPVAGTDGPALAARARAALERFLDPLRGGPDQKGWPVGRDVHRAEVMALLNDLPGVDYVDEVVLQTDAQPGARCGNAAVCPHGLVTSGTHTIKIDLGSRCS